MNRVLKISLNFITVLVVGFLLYFELELLITRHYTAIFIDPLDITNLAWFGTLALVLISAFGMVNFKSKQKKFIFLGISITLITVSSLLSLMLLNKRGRTVYRQDLGLKAYYLYLSEKGDYILEYTWPFGKSIIIGHYKQNGSEIRFDKDIVEALYLKKGNQYQEPIRSLDLRDMKKIK